MVEEVSVIAQWVHCLSVLAQLELVALALALAALVMAAQELINSGHWVALAAATTPAVGEGDRPRRSSPSTDPGGKSSCR